jgi:hypothetical protein
MARIAQTIPPDVARIQNGMLPLRSDRKSEADRETIRASAQRASKINRGVNRKTKTTSLLRNWWSDLLWVLGFGLENKLQAEFNLSLASPV